MDGAMARAERVEDDAAGADGLTRREHDVLAFERQWWKYAGAKEQAIRDLFDLSSTRYYQLLNQLISSGIFWHLSFLEEFLQGFIQAHDSHAAPIYIDLSESHNAGATATTAAPLISEDLIFQSHNSRQIISIFADI